MPEAIPQGRWTTEPTTIKWLNVEYRGDKVNGGISNRIEDFGRKRNEVEILKALQVLAKLA